MIWLAIAAACAISGTLGYLAACLGRAAERGGDVMAVADATREPPAPGAAPARAPGPRLLMTSNFYSDGTTIVYDHQRRRSHRFGPGAGDFDDIDRALREELGL